MKITESQTNATIESQILSGQIVQCAKCHGFFDNPDDLTDDVCDNCWLAIADDTDKMIENLKVTI